MSLVDALSRVLRGARRELARVFVLLRVIAPRFISSRFITSRFIASRFIASRVIALTFALSIALTACADGGADDAGAHDDENDDDGGSASVDVSRFAVRVVSHTVGEGGGFGEDRLPDVVTGPPKGFGEQQGSTDVFSLGHGGEIVVELGSEVIDGAGVDFIVFENAFRYGPRVFTEPGEVAVSLDGLEWTVFPCAPDDDVTGCAGTAPVLSHPENDVDALDPLVSGGDVFDLQTIGVSSMRFVRIRDRSSAAGDPSITTGGFDFDAVSIVHARAIDVD